MSRLRFVFAALAAFAFGGNAAAGSSRDVRLPDYQTVQLDNGATLLLAPRKEVPMVAATVLVRGGALADPDGKEGTAGLLAELLSQGAGSRDALARVDIAAASPQRMDSEGLLAMPALQAVDGVDVGFVTAPGGRGKIAATLQARGAIVHRADVYLRQPVAIRAAAWHRLQAALADPARVLLLASSEEALRAMLAQAPSGLQPGLRNVAVAVPGERLANVVRAAGFGRVVDTGSPRPAAMLREAAAIA